MVNEDNPNDITFYEHGKMASYTPKYEAEEYLENLRQKCLKKRGGFE